MKTFLIIIAILLATLLTASAQMYEKSAGIRLGYTNSIFFEKQNEDLTSHRFMFNWREGGRNITAMKIIRNYRMTELPNSVSFYYGYGVHAGYVRWNKKITDTTHGYYWEKRTSTIVGLDAIIGLSYDLTTMPVSLTCDIKPYFDLLGPKSFHAMPYDFAIGAVYYF